MQTKLRAKRWRTFCRIVLSANLILASAACFSAPLKGVWTSQYDYLFGKKIQIRFDFDAKLLVLVDASRRLDLPLRFGPTDHELTANLGFGDENYVVKEQAELMFLCVKAEPSNCIKLNKEEK
ncbi:MAG: hypothetical protein V4582_13665 [Pseudomonadota bacterium]